MNTFIAHILSKTELNEQEAWWMLESILQKSKEEIITSHEEIPSYQQKIIDEWIKKLTADHMPLAYLIGWVPFLDVKLSLAPPILIPRAETEEWVDSVISSLKPHKQSIKKILDIGTGSGCIALSLAQHFPEAEVTATDINPTALKLAQHNAHQNNIKNITFVTSDLFENLSGQTFDLIVSNPPYIDPIDKKEMMPQVTEWEDKKALFANKQGLEIIENIIKQAPKHLRKNSYLPYQLVIEYGFNQKESMQSLAKTYNWDYSIHKDLFGNFRTIRLRRPD